MRKLLSLLLTLSLLLCVGCGKKETPKKEEAEPDSSVRLSAVGDIFLTDAVLRSANADFTALFSEVTNELSAADLTIGNLEGTLAGAPYGAAEENYPDAFANALYEAGFDILQTANSCSVQRGLAGLQRTISVLQEAGIAAAGTYASAEARQSAPVLIREVNGIRIAFVAFTKGVGGMSLPQSADWCVNLLYSDYTDRYSSINTSAIREIMRAARAEAPDIIVASVHWGSENATEISSSQSAIADLLIEEGADVILGSHSHTVCPIERRSVNVSGAKKEVVIAYGLGDFCDAEAGAVNFSLILNVEFRRDGQTGRTTLSQADYTPIATADYGKDSAVRYRVFGVKAAIERYRSNYFDRVSKDIYDVLEKGMERLSRSTDPDAQ